jgi:hypothetical protein
MWEAGRCARGRCRLHMVQVLWIVVRKVVMAEKGLGREGGGVSRKRLSLVVPGG